MTGRTPTTLRSRVSASVAAADTETCLAELHRLRDGVGSAEVRLDLMTSFDVARIVAESPVPLVLTCRAPREGGSFAGTEAQRLAVLRAAYESGAAFVDVEADCVDEVAGWGASPTQVIVSRHWYDSMPTDLLEHYERLRQAADVVKLVGWADTVVDTVPVLRLLREATTPVIALAMGEAGGLTRLVGPHFDSCLLTYGVADPAKATAGGQFTLAEMIDTYHLESVTPETDVTVHVCTTPDQVATAADVQSAAVPGAELHLAVRVEPADRERVQHELAQALPGVRVEG